ncbi:MAG: undecaprenyldiphospho-muramoylpentapeptide beta-N-acetylglucosaminyltransferase [Ectothiorhodospiraceae bacterium]|nr:undecaprenyldiphospho-muramoylpentapeptide beta-N-acetylglucosaminyltransferase [Ectothiorhodospiraceae bacterium]MCH8506009.1 undecaprenyldiphospho-muramoylpentapeptide beta-N-acetylglucosaminyltransferase [Ectothiorhodospiraceae bacterium]
MSVRQTRPVLIMAGGTGGHVFPGLAVAQVLQERGVPVVWLGTRAGLEARLVPDAGLAIEWLDIRGLRGKGVRGWLLAPFRLAAAVRQSLGVLRRHQPRAVLGLGGYVAGPGGLAARLAGYRLVLHEQNAVPGLTNRMLSRVADQVLCGFPADFPKGVAARVVGNPVRDAILSLPAPEERFQDREGPLRLLVIGGSLGAQVLNECVPAAVARLPEDRRPLVRHQAGERTLDVALENYRRHKVEGDVTAFIDDMASAYAWADLVICRAGALTVSELAAAGVAACLVPLPHAVDDHQSGNARFLADRQAALLLPQQELCPEHLAQLLEEYGDGRRALLAMAQRARDLVRPAAAEDVADACLEAA